MRVTEGGDGWTPERESEKGGWRVTKRKETYWCEQDRSSKGETDRPADVMGPGSREGLEAG